MEPHFTALPKSLPGLETLEGGGVKFSFANLMHVHRPLMIVDEAHNAVTGLTREMQARVNPSAIIEFTATPRLNSNILHSVTAQELKLEEMIKLPIMLSEHDTWQNAVNGAIASRASLAEARRHPSAGTRWRLPAVSLRSGSQGRGVLRRGFRVQGRNVLGSAPVSWALETSQALPWAGPCACLRWGRER
jgi:hypothetical protein